MKEIKAILRFFEQSQHSGERCALAQVVRVDGSSYRREGARMIVFESGIFEGGISGGCLEGDALKRSQLAIVKQEATLITYDTSKELEIGIGLGCNGIIDVLLTPISKDSQQINILNKIVSERKTHLIVTIIGSNLKDKALKPGSCLYYDTEKKCLEGLGSSDIKDFILEKIDQVQSEQRSGSYLYTSTDTELSFHLEWVPAQYHLAIFGDNYDVYPLIQIAGLLDWEISLVGNVQKLKKEYLTPVRNIYPKNSTQRPVIDERTAIVLMAHDFKTDLEHFKFALQSISPYIASLGPKTRYEKIRKSLGDTGGFVDELEKNRIYAPCGLDIGADSPEEIALSLCSEIISVFSGKAGGMLKDKIGPIHDRN
ncbi:MAG: XdhC family protein [Lutimonas sp.]|jgi:xanthine dehydrogenase accessory factor